MTTSDKLTALAATVRRIGRGYTDQAKRLADRAETHKGETE